MKTAHLSITVASSKGGKIIVSLKSVNKLRQLYFLTKCTSMVNHHLPFKPRWINHVYAFIHSYFWLPCHLCGRTFGGHEFYGSKHGKGVCPECVLKHYNETGEYDDWASDSNKENPK